MTITEIAQAFKRHGFNFSEQEVEERLAEAKMKPEEVDADLVEVWIEDHQQRQRQPAKSGKGGGLAKGKPAQPPAPQAPTQQQQAQEINFAPLTSTIHATVEQIVKANHEGEQQAVLAVGAYLKASPERIVNGVSQQLATVDVSGSLDAMLRKQRDAWTSTNSAIADIINSVNTAAGVSRDAAA